MLTSLEKFKGEAIIIKEDGDTKADDAGVQSDIWDRWVMDVYTLVLPHIVKLSLEGLHLLCIRWCKRKFIHGMFKWLWDKFG